MIERTNERTIKQMNEWIQEKGNTLMNRGMNRRNQKSEIHCILGFILWFQNFPIAWWVWRILDATQ